MNIIVKVLIGVIVLVIASLTLMSYMNRPLSKENAHKEIQKSIEKFVDKNELDNTLLRIYSDKLNLDESFEVGNDENLNENSRYHSASIGKTFTTVLMYQLQEEGILNLNDAITTYLDTSILQNIFVVDDVDYKDEVTIQMLLNHTSGAGDYFEDPVIAGQTLIEMMKENPDKLWTPQELVFFTRDNQVAVNQPGKDFHYSDTAYILAGMVIEEATSKAFHDVLHERIFNPLKLNDTNLTHKSESNNGSVDMLPIYIDDMDFSHTNALSIDWSGGGLTTTTGDLLTFFKGLHDGLLITQNSLDDMKTFKYEYDKGINYGVGMMSFNLPELSPLLRGMSNIYGGVGATASFMLYDEVNDIYIVMNVGSIDMTEASIGEIIKILMIINRIDLEK